jgi:hypothetical protein
MSKRWGFKMSEGKTIDGNIIILNVINSPGRYG